MHAGQRLVSKRIDAAVAREKRRKRKPSAAAVARRFKAEYIRKARADINEHKSKCGPGMFGHNIITLALRGIAEKYGNAEANAAIRDCGLLERGWKEE